MFDKTGGVAEEANVASGVLFTPIGKGRLHRSSSDTFGSLDARGSIVRLIAVVGKLGMVWVARFLRDSSLFRYAVSFVIVGKLGMSRISGSAGCANLRGHAVGLIVIGKARMSRVAGFPWNFGLAWHAIGLIVARETWVSGIAGSSRCANLRGYAV